MNKSNVRLVFVLLIMCITLVMIGCGKNDDASSENYKDGEIVYTYRTSYIGDNAKVTQIVDVFYGPYKSIALQTDQEPYELHVYLKELPDDESSMDYKNALILSLIKNADSITLHDDENEFTTFKDDASDILGHEPNEVHEDEELFIELYNGI